MTKEDFNKFSETLDIMFSKIQRSIVELEIESPVGNEIRDNFLEECIFLNHDIKNSLEKFIKISKKKTNNKNKNK